MGTKGERRERKLKKRRYGHKVDGRSVLVLQERVNRRVQEAKRKEEQK